MKATSAADVNQKFVYLTSQGVGRSSVTTLTLPRWFGRTRSAASARDPGPSRASLRIGIPRVLNLWSTHQFWVGFFGELGIEARQLVFSSDTSEEQGRQFGKGRARWTAAIRSSAPPATTAS